MPTNIVDLPREAIAAACRKHAVKRLWLFGSMARGDFGPRSDYDFLVEFEDSALISLLDISALRNELIDVLGGERDVDLVEHHCLKKNRAPYVLGEAEVVYAA